ncbi:MAG TPA: hypothetical protein VL133_10045 [Devosia sp.]|nr:hypothetical protein [Devosia sp.]
MTDHHSTAVALWKEQDMTPQTLSTEMLAGRHQALARTVTIRNRLEFIAGALVIIGTIAATAASMANSGFTMAVVGLVALGLGAAFVCLQLWLRARAPTPVVGASPSVQQYRSDLQRQRDALATAWLWYLLPFVPGFVLIYGDMALEMGSGWRLAVTLGLAAATAGFMLWVWRLNHRAAREFDVEIANLDR